MKIITGIVIMAMCGLGLYISASRHGNPRRAEPSDAQSFTVSSGNDTAVTKGVVPPPHNVQVESELYKKTRSIFWLTGHHEVPVQADLDVLKIPLQDVPPKTPFSLLKITSLPSGRIIHQEKVQDFPITMYTRDLDGDKQEELIIIWEAGAVASRIEILSVNEDKATVLLNEDYRVKADLVEGNDGKVDVVITTGESGAGPFVSTRYSWKKGGVYQPVSRSPYRSPH